MDLPGVSLEPNDNFDEPRDDPDYSGSVLREKLPFKTCCYTKSEVTHLEPFTRLFLLCRASACVLEPTEKQTESTTGRDRFSPFAETWIDVRIDRSTHRAQPCAVNSQAALYVR